MALRQGGIAGLLLLLLSCYNVVRLSASPLPSIIRAATSKNGKFLVVSTLELGPAGVGGGQAILGDTFDISPNERFVNEGTSLTAPNTYYAEFGWQVVMRGVPGFYTAWPILSDDGKTLILINPSPLLRKQSLIAIYKENAGIGILIRSYKAEELWEMPARPDKIEMVTDATPLWFAKGTFFFSDDNTSLVYKSQEKGRLKFRLQDGAITRSLR